MHPMNVLDMHCIKGCELPAFIKNMSIAHTLMKVGFYGKLSQSMCKKFDITEHVSSFLLLSEDGCQTNFHIDMTGTTVMYTLLKGQKTFFVVEPSCRNIDIMAEWDKSSEKE